MKKYLLTLAALAITAFLIAGCGDGGSGGPLRPIANKGGAAPAAKAGGGPHPMPGAGSAGN